MLQLQKIKYEYFKKKLTVCNHTVYITHKHRPSVRPPPLTKRFSSYTKELPQDSLSFAAAATAAASTQEAAAGSRFCLWCAKESRSHYLVFSKYFHPIAKHPSAATVTIVVSSRSQISDSSCPASFGAATYLRSDSIAKAFLSSSSIVIPANQAAAREATQSPKVIIVSFGEARKAA